MMALAFFAIAGTLVYLLRAGKTLPFKRTAIVVSTFVVACA